MIAESDQDCLYDNTFQQDIKNCRFYCQLVDNKLKCQLIEIAKDQYYQAQYDSLNIPQEFTRYNKDLEQVYQFISIKTKIFKNPLPGVIMCCQYMGRVEKFITIRMAKVEPPLQVRENCHFALLQRCCRDLFTNIRILRAGLKVKSKELTFYSHQNPKKIDLTNEKETRRGKYQIHCSLKKNKRPPNSLEKRKNSVQEAAQYKMIQSKASQVREQCKVDIVPAQSNLPQNMPQKHLPIQTITVEAMLVQTCEERLLVSLSKTSPFYNRFRITGSQIEKINNSQPFQVHSTNPIPKNSKTYFTVYIGKTKYKSITIGVLAQKYYEKTIKADRRCFSVCFDGYYGIILNQSVQVKSDLLKFCEGDTVKTLVNLIQMSIEWIINAQAIAKVPISLQLSEYQLYPYIQMEDKGDIVVLNRQEPNPK